MPTRFVKYGLLLATLCSAGAFAGAPKAAHKYSVTPIAAPENSDCAPGFVQRTFTRRMNESGEIVGYHECWQASGIPEAPYLLGRTTGFAWSPTSGTRALPPMRAESVWGTMGRSINEAGIVVGRETANDGMAAPIWFPWGGGDLIVPWVPCGFFTITAAEEINDHNAIAMRSWMAACGTRWVLRLANGEQFVGPIGAPAALNNNNVMVGTSALNAMKWSPTIGEMILGPPRTTPAERALAYNINDQGVAVGEVYHFDQLTGCLAASDAVKWSQDGAEQVLKRLPGHTQAIALGINEESIVVGRSSGVPACVGYDEEVTRAVIWRTKKPKELSRLLKGEDAVGIQLVSASAINNTGQIAAWGFYRDEPLANCWDYFYDENGGEHYDTTLTCRNMHAFLLTPIE